LNIKKQIRREKALFRLENQLLSNEKTVKKTFHVVEDLTPKDKIRIKKEIEILKSRVR
jgi:hypothetical protein